MILSLSLLTLTLTPRRFEKLAAFGAFGLFAVFCAIGTTIGFENHSAFLFGVGNLPSFIPESLPFLTHSEPLNALSLPTWLVHFSSVFEFLFAMNLIWKYAEVTKNEKWKGLTWGMIPLHASGIAACTDHFFYNDPRLQGVVTTQAGLTCLGNLTLAFAAWRLAVSNGWTFGELNPFRDKENELSLSPSSELVTYESKDTDFSLGVKLFSLTVFCSYLTKYGELAFNTPYSGNLLLAGAMILTPPAVVAGVLYKSSGERVEEVAMVNNAVPFFADSVKEEGEGGEEEEEEEEKGLSMASVKKFGVAGTIAYVITELLFWVVAFPVAGQALYTSTGHWPDVINVSDDRAAVLAFIFAGANIARLAVPLRLGAAIALAPWVDENLINRK